MSASRSSVPARRPSRLRLGLGLSAVVLATVAVVVLVYLFGGSAPAPVGLASPSAATGGASGLPAATSESGTSAAGFDGTWVVDTATGSFADFTNSFVGYRVDEELADIGATTAVGRTPKVSGSLTLAGSSITAVSITADLTALQSDKSMRDGQLRRQALETDAFPTATFTLATPITLDRQPADGETISITATGDLMLHGVTKRVSIPLQAKLSGGTVTVVGSLPVAFADYAIKSPSSMIVLSVADIATVELHLLFARG